MPTTIWNYKYTEKTKFPLLWNIIKKVIWNMTLILSKSFWLQIEGHTLVLITSMATLKKKKYLSSLSVDPCLSIVCWHSHRGKIKKDKSLSHCCGVKIHAEFAFHCKELLNNFLQDGRKPQGIAHTLNLFYDCGLYFSRGLAFEVIFVSSTVFMLYYS